MSEPNKKLMYLPQPIYYTSPQLPLKIRCRLFFYEITRHFASEKINEYICIESEFKELISRENATISKICFSFACSVAEFDDLRQDALINIWRGIKQFRREATGRTWIYRVTVNSCISTIRKQSRHRHESLDELYNMISSSDIDIDKESIEQMHHIINTLGSQDKAIIMMWLDEMNYDEIAEAMGLNRNTVATRLRRIKEKISKEYKKEDSL